MLAGVTESSPLVTVTLLIGPPLDVYASPESQGKAKD